MHEKAKLEEAHYFYEGMGECHDDRKPFLHNLSAFLSSARSVLQYALREARSKPGGVQWYEARVSKSRTLGFFKDQRDINIHRQPLAPRQDVAIQLTETLHLSASLGIAFIDEQGKVVKETVIEDSPPQPAPIACLPITTIRHSFAAWAGPEDVMALSKLYLDELESVVNDGITKGFLPP
jgi:hypothetical protein